MASKPDPVDALLKSGPRRTHLPEPAERARLRTDYGLTQAEIAAALDVTRTTVAGWEAGRSEPQGATRAAYAKLLEGIATQLAAASPSSSAPPAAEQPAPSAPRAPQAAPTTPKSPSAPPVGPGAAAPPQARTPSEA
ncbi:helix-turn-helix transcriptional regulator, partial [Streptomyces albidochromogenes]